MTTETHTVAMTDPQLANNNNNNNSNTNNNNNNNNNTSNNNNDGEPKYLHKKFKKMATTEVTPRVEPVALPNDSGSPEPAKKDTKEGPPKDSIGAEASPEAPDGESTESRKSGYMCPYCRLSCAKPSVLQKHIRAHTNERPYPCVPCGFAFKTKSNLYKHCRSRAHALKMEGGDASKVSEDSDISLSDSASNGTGTPPPPPSSTPTTIVASVKTIKTGKIYKPKFHTALQCVNTDTETSSLSTAATMTSTCSSTSSGVGGAAKANPEQVQEHIAKIITDNRAIVDAVDPRLHKLVHRQQSLVEAKHPDQPLNLSSAEECSRKRRYSESFLPDSKDRRDGPDGSMTKDRLSSEQNSSEEGATESNDSYLCPACGIPYSSIDNLDAHRRYYCKGIASPRKEYEPETERREPDFDAKSSDYYGALQPLPSPGPLLGTTRLVDAYAPPAKKQRTESVVPTTLRSLEELSKYPRPNSLQMFGGEVRILDKTGETKTMRIEPRQTNSPTSEHVASSKGVTSETASIVVRSGLHSGGTMVHKPSGTPVSTPGASISLPNTPKMLAPIIPNISTPSIAPSMSCYNYLEPHLNPLTSIAAYNPLTLPQPGIANILHGDKVIPYVPGMPGPHTLPPPLDISSSIGSGEAGYKVIPGLPGLHMVPPRPLDLASPVKIQTTPSVPGIPGPMSSGGPASMLGQPLDLASPAKEAKLGFKAPGSEAIKPGLASPKIAAASQETCCPDKYRRGATSGGEMAKMELDRHIKNNVAAKCKAAESPRERRDPAYERNPRAERGPGYANGTDSERNSYSRLRYSPKECSESKKRQAAWSATEPEPGRASVLSMGHAAAVKYDSPVARTENGRLKPSASDSRGKFPEYYGAYGEAKASAASAPMDGSRAAEAASKASADSIAKPDKPEAKSPRSGEAAGSREESGANKFLRPTSLPLKPGTFTPKKHHGITPTANTLPLISPETPRPKKSYGQLYLNGHAYTYLGLKCSTRVFYCTLNRPQPMYVAQQHGLSMYSNWKICKEAPPDVDMARYDSRHRPRSYTTAWKKQEDILTHSSQRPTTPTSPDSGLDGDTQEKTKRVKIFDGGFESNEDYTYVRGRGRGRYVCEECGIRCKKPSMLKKHIRTHTDVRPYTCKHCAFSFKTKGNLTKHMKSKAHYKKCVELAIVPVPTTVCDENIDKEALALLVAGGNAEESSDEEEESDGEESEESGSEEQEAAQSLLSLSQRNANRLPGLLPSGRPTTYPYTLTFPTTSASTSATATTTVAVAVATSSASVASPAVTTQETTLVRNELSHRYYFSTSRAAAEESRSSVIRSSKKESSDVEANEADADAKNSLPMDLTTKTAPPPSPIPRRARPADILTPVSEPVLLQTIVQTMERLPIQGRGWKPDAEGHMLQAYLTERHVMDSKIKQQYRVGNTKAEKQREREIYPAGHPSPKTMPTEGDGVPVSSAYSDPSQPHLSAVDVRIKHPVKHPVDDIRMEIREKIYQNNVGAERRSFDVGTIHRDKEVDRFEQASASPVGSGKTCIEYSPTKGTTCIEIAGSSYPVESAGRSTPQAVVDRRSPRTFDVDASSRILGTVTHAISVTDGIERNSMMYNPGQTMTEVDRAREIGPTCHEIRSAPSDSRMQTLDARLLHAREVRGHSQDYRPQPQDLRSLGGQDYKLCRQELRPPSREYKPPCHDPRPSQEISNIMEMRQPNPDTGSPSRDMILLSEYNRHGPPQEPRIAAFEMIPPTMHDQSKMQELSRPPQNVDARGGMDRHEPKHAEITKQSIAESIKHTVARKMVVAGPGFRSPSPSPTPAVNKPQAEFLQPSNGPAPNYVSVTEDGRSVCGICNKVFSKHSQLRLHFNIHYFERPFRCESCAVSFRTKGHLTKHERSVSHHNKVSMTSTFGAATTSNPRPFKCTDCKIAFRIHGHLAKHLRSKMHIMKLECLGKLPFGTYAEMERSGVNLNDIDTTDCDNSLTSLQMLAQRLCEKDPNKIGQWESETIPSQVISGGETSSDEGEPIPQHGMHPYPVKVTDADMSRSYHVPIANEDPKSDIRLGGNPQFNQQKREYSVKEKLNQPKFPIDDTRPEEGIQSYKCQVCTVSMRTMNELQVHCFVEHNIESDSSTNTQVDRGVNKCREKENTQKRNTEEAVVQEDHNRQKVKDV